MTPAPRISVVLSTHNRSRRLAHALRALLAQRDAPPHEILLVDNRSTDDTREVVESLMREAGDGRLVYTYEPRQGLSHGRNHGIARARAPLIAFTDDDVVADPDWLAAIERAFARHREAVYVGGRVLPAWDTEPPSWLTAAHWSPLALQDHGSQPFEVGPDRPICLVGANVAFRAEAFGTVGLFSAHVQLTPGMMGTTEDHEFMRRVWDQGGHGVYEPAIVVRTDVQPERRTRRYHRRWHYEHGRSHARMRIPETERSRGRVLGAPVHMFRQAIVDLRDRAWHAVRRDGPAGFAAETRLWFFAGFVIERVARRGGRTAFAEASASLAGALARGRKGRPDEAAEANDRDRPNDAAADLVSIVIPCYKQASYLPESIGSALAQSHRPIEVVVVDDGSPDETAAVAARYEGVRCIRQPNRGLAHARNAGLAACRGSYVVFLDADDRLHPHAVERGLRALREQPEAALAFGRPRVIDTHGAPMFTPPESAVRITHGDAYAALLRSNIVWAPAVVVFRRRVLDETGGFDPSVHASADYDLYLRIARRHPLADHGDVVADYRNHGAAMSRDAGVMLRTTLAVHRRQRRAARGTAEHRRAYRDGRRFWQRFYGDQVMDGARAALGAREYARLASGLVTMMRWAPARLAWHAGRWLHAGRGSPLQENERRGKT